MNRLIKLLAMMLVSFVCISQNVGQSNANLPRKGGVVLSDVPRKVDVRVRYLFYLHGYIVEAGNTRPTSPKFGVYEYEQILDTFKQEGFIVISEARKKTPEIEPYATKVAEQVRRLLRARSAAGTHHRRWGFARLVDNDARIHLFRKSPPQLRSYRCLLC